MIRPSTLDRIWFGEGPYNVLAIYLGIEKWATRGWAEAAATNDIDTAADWTETLVDLIALRHSGKPGRHNYKCTPLVITR